MPHTCCKAIFKASTSIYSHISNYVSNLQSNPPSNSKPYLKHIIVALFAIYLAFSIPNVLETKRVYDVVSHGYIWSDIAVVGGTIKAFYGGQPNPYDRQQVVAAMAAEGYTGFVPAPFVYFPIYFLLFGWLQWLSFTQIFVLDFLLHIALWLHLAFFIAKQKAWANIGFGLPQSLTVSGAIFFGFLNQGNYLIGTINIYLFYGFFLWLLTMRSQLALASNSLVLLISTLKFGFFLALVPIMALHLRRLWPAIGIAAVIFIGYSLYSQPLWQYYSAFSQEIFTDHYSMGGVNLGDKNISLYGNYFRLQYVLKAAFGIQLHLLPIFKVVTALGLLAFGLILYRWRAQPAKIYSLSLLAVCFGFLLFPITWLEYLPLLFIALLVDGALNDRLPSALLSILAMGLAAVIISFTPISMAEGNVLWPKALFLAISTLPTLVLLAIGYSSLRFAAAGISQPEAVPAAASQA